MCPMLTLGTSTPDAKGCKTIPRGRDAFCFAIEELGNLVTVARTKSVGALNCARSWRKAVICVSCAPGWFICPPTPP